MSADKHDRLAEDFKKEINEARRCILDLYFRVGEARDGLGGVEDMANIALREATRALLNLETDFVELQQKAQVTQ
jgi:hypothetical protein